MLEIAALVLSIIAIPIWYMGRNGKNEKIFNKDNISKEYLLGLNYLLNEQPDKAVDVFIKMLEVDSETVETHLALGNLFRKRGEVDRAIRIHQNLIARPNLTKSERIQALLALGRDYMFAGVLDRAEGLFIDVIETGEFVPQSLHYLLDIYEQEKDWGKALDIAQKIEMNTPQSMHQVIAQYCCELAIEQRNKSNYEQANKLLKRALCVDKHCVRACLLQGEWEMRDGNYKVALRAYKQIKEQAPDYLSESIAPLVICYQKLGNEQELIEYLQNCLNDDPRMGFVLPLSEVLQRFQGSQVAIEFLINKLQKHPSLRGLKYLVELQIDSAESKVKEQFYLLKDLLEKLLQDKPIYRCGHCGFSGKVLHWQCPSCKSWSSIKPIHGLEGD